MALVFGGLSALGLSLVANFQETNLEGVHMTGAAMTIGCGILYMFSQTALSYKMADTLSLSRLRLIMAVICSLTAASCILHGYPAHVTAAVSEWLTCIVYLLFYATFVQDFKRTTVSVNLNIITMEESEGIKV
uniref:DNA damage-regulated autophagy modulator protein 2 n=1 Tax=Magallana gigas TaxID=29159 RepID=K1QLA5_MAGGI